MKRSVDIPVQDVAPPALFRGLAFGLMLAAPMWAALGWWAFA